MRHQPAEPAGEGRFGHREVAYPELEVLAVGVDRPDHHLVAEDEVEVDPISRNLELPIAAGHARKHEHPVLAERLHRLEGKRGVAGRFEDQIEGAMLHRALEQRQIERREVACAERLDQIGVEVRLGRASEDRDLEAAQTKAHRGE